MSEYFFSRIQLDVQHPQAKQAVQRSLTANAYHDHQWFWREFFPAERGAERDYIFRRIDASAADQAPVYYVVSRREPKLGNAAWRLDCRPYAPCIEAGSVLGFDLRANPIVRQWPGKDDRKTNAQGKRKPGKVTQFDVVMHEKKRLLAERGLQHWKDWHGSDRPVLYELVHRICVEWLNGQAPNHGFRLAQPAAKLQVDGYRRHMLQGKEHRKDIVLSTVDFQGVLEVTDTDKFARTLLSGIGHGKAFGCGLLLVRRI